MVIPGNHAALANYEKMPGRNSVQTLAQLPRRLRRTAGAPLEALADGIDLDADRCQGGKAEEWLGARGSIQYRSADDLSRELDVRNRDVHDDLVAVGQFVNARALGLQADGVEVPAWHEGIGGACVDAASP